MIEVWMGSRLKQGRYVSDGRLLFRRQDVIKPSLLKTIDSINMDLMFTIRPQKLAHTTFVTLKKTATQILELDSCSQYKTQKNGGMLFKDCFGDEWQIQRNYYQLAKKLLGFDFILGGKNDFVAFVKNSEIISVLMCLF